MMKRMSTLSSENRNDLHLTSTGVGHAARESRPFPPPSFKVGQEWCARYAMFVYMCVIALD